MRILSLMLCLLILSGCQKDNSKPVSPEAGDTAGTITDPLERIASLYKVKVTLISLPDGKEGSGDTYSIKIDNLNLETRKPYSPALIASKSAMIVFRSLTAQEKKNIQAIDIHVNSIFKTDIFPFRLSGLRKIEPYIKVARSGVRNYIDGDYEGFYSLTDPAYFTKLEYDEFIEKSKKPFPEAFEGIKEIEDDGFEFDREEGLNVIRVYYTTGSSGKKKLEWEIVFLDDDKDPKIGGFHVMRGN